MFLRFLTLVCAWAFLNAPLSADALYDVGSNTTFATFNAAFAQALAENPGPFGVTVRVRAMVPAPGALDLDAGLLGLQPQPAHPLVIEAGSGVAAVISGAGAYGIRISGVANVTVQGLTVQGFSVNSVKLQNAANASFLNNVLKGAGAGAVDAKDCNNLVLRGNSLSAPDGTTAVLVDGCDSALLQDNTVLSASAPSYGLVLRSSAHAQMLGNRADNADKAFNVFSSAAVTVNANVAIGRGKSYGLVLDNSPGVLITRNLLVGQTIGLELQSSKDCGAYQNTVWEHGTAGLHVGTSSGNLTLRNNLFHGYFALYFSSASQSTVNSNYNGYGFTSQMGVGTGSYVTLGDWQVTGQDATAINADPLFAGVSGTQPEAFKLQPGSPMRGFGTDLSALLSSDYFGNPLAAAPAIWDPGIHVVSAVQNTPTPTPTPTMVQPTATPTYTATPTVTPSFTASPIGTATFTPSITPTLTVTPTFTVTPYPFRHDRVLSYPNPWSPSSGAPLNIVFEPDANATLRLFDMAGELLIQLPDSAIQAQLGHAVWDGRDREGSLVPSGLYVLVVNTPRGTRFSRFTVLY